MWTTNRNIIASKWHTVCSTDTLYAVIMGNKHSSLECQLVCFLFKSILFNEKIMWFFTFFSKHNENNQSPVRSCVCVCVFWPFSWYSLQVWRCEKKSHINIYIYCANLFGDRKTTVHSDFILIHFIYAAVCFFLLSLSLSLCRYNLLFSQPSWSHQFALRVVCSNEHDCDQHFFTFKVRPNFIIEFTLSIRFSP